MKRIFAIIMAFIMFLPTNTIVNAATKGGVTEFYRIDFPNPIEIFQGKDIAGDLYLSSNHTKILLEAIKRADPTPSLTDLIKSAVTLKTEEWVLYIIKYIAGDLLKTAYSEVSAANIQGTGIIITFSGKAGKAPIVRPQSEPTAVEERFQIKVTVSPTQGGTTAGGGNYKKGARAQLDAYPYNNWQFAGWYEDNTLVGQNKHFSFIVDSERAIEARFAQKGSTVTPPPSTQPPTQPPKDTTIENVIFSSVGSRDITDNNATPYCTVKYEGTRPSSVGLYFGKSSSSMSRVASDSNINHSKNPFDTWYDLNDEAGEYLDDGTTYYYQFYAIVNGKEFLSSTKSFTTEKQVENNVDFRNIGERDVTESNAEPYCTIEYEGTRPSSVGLYFGESRSSMERVASDGNINHNKNPFDAWYDLNDEAGEYLDEDTTYYYQFYAIVDGEEFTSGIQSFITEVVKPEPTEEPQTKESTLTIEGFSYSFDGSRIELNGTVTSNYLLTNCLGTVNVNGYKTYPDGSNVISGGILMPRDGSIDEYSYDISELNDVINRELAKWLKDVDYVEIGDVSITFRDESGASVSASAN